MALVFVGGLVGVAAASGTATDKKAEKAADKPMKKPATKSASGTVKSASADSIVVAGKDKGKEAEWTFGLDGTTKIKKGGKDATAADLKAGDSVQVKYMEDGGKATAQSVMAKESKAEKKAEKAAEKAEKKAEKK
jgi:hypothetical protein